MKKYVLFLSLLLSGLQPAWAENLPERLSAVRAELLASEPVATYDFRQLQSQFPTPLLIPTTLLPQSAKYPLKSLRRLYQGSLTCKGPWPVTPLLTQPLVFTRALCNNTVLPVGWFARAGYIHPGGGSYAARYLAVHPDMEQQLARFLHVQERELAPTNTALGRLQRMSPDEVAVYIAGAEAFVSNGELWIRNGNEYHIYDQPVWSQAMGKFDVNFTRLKHDGFCILKSGNICWAEEDQSHLTSYLLVGLLVVNIGLLVGWGFYRWRIRRRAMQERMLVLQILTHELRTPIASLAMTVEGFRRHFDALPESLYDEFRRLTEDSRRLRQLAEASKDYLQANQQELSVSHVESFNEWVEYLSEPYEVTLELAQDRPVDVNVYWLGTCIDNLLSNAHKYGVKPVKLTSSFDSGKLIVRVSDNGPLSHKDWARLRKPFVSEKGLGLGLTIVESMIRRMGGRMKLVGPPTTFILEIPCESDSASG
ncbi:histidine kinase [Photobacterium aquae]|uniref:histidine kinase n=1 Tax=Photobacterium aquae TaxID=1195763 RepID=A0A0J1GV85_9GAMM|nr:sensor histidine kinase VxrA [Photobacterium aquae]KLV03324.1 histidine kinase [Photobacterium aquae]